MIDFTNAPLTAALVAHHQRQTEALPMNPPQDVMLAHAQRQALELLAHAAEMERCAVRAVMK